MLFNKVLTQSKRWSNTWSTWVGDHWPYYLYRVMAYCHWTFANPKMMDLCLAQVTGYEQLAAGCYVVLSNNHSDILTCAHYNTSPVLY